jgi:hypothetical protein
LFGNCIVQHEKHPIAKHQSGKRRLIVTLSLTAQANCGSHLSRQVLRTSRSA